MAYFRTLPKLQTMLDQCNRDDNWLICINADPDAMASAKALSRILSRKVKDIAIAKVNEITRPDNLAMIRYCRIEMLDLTEELPTHFQKFAMVDSQPHHHPLFQNIHFSIIIDHHPLPENPHPAEYSDIMPDYGATSTMMLEHMYNLDLRPSKLLATALQFGIKTDTLNFERNSIFADLRAFQYLAKYADHNVLTRITKSEFLLRWLEFFAKACTNIYSLGCGQFSYIGKIESPDILVNIADFFMRVYEISWVAISGICGESIITVFRSDGIGTDVGSFAQRVFGPLGSAGGHKTMARAEIPLAAAGGQSPEIFLWQCLKKAPKRKVCHHVSAPPETPPVSATASGKPADTVKQQPQQKAATVSITPVEGKMTVATQSSVHSIEKTAQPAREKKSVPLSVTAGKNTKTAQSTGVEAKNGNGAIPPSSSTIVYGKTSGTLYCPAGSKNAQEKPPAAVPADKAQAQAALAKAQEITAQLAKQNEHVADNEIDPAQ